MNTLPSDIFGRQQLAETMSDVIINLPNNDYSPIILDGPWGSGKTTHAQRIIHTLKNKYADKAKCIYWDASSSDFTQHPMLMFIAELYKHITDSEGKNNFKENGLPIFAKYIFKGSANLINQITKNIVNIDIQEVVDYATKGEATPTHYKSELKKYFDLYISQSSNERSIIQAAEKLIDIVRKDKNLIIIIDEFDRSRPNFALELLENIKHLFEKSSCKFLLVMNRESMVASVMHLYGLDKESATRYLNKYFKLSLILPQHPVYWDGKHDCNFLYFHQLLSDNAIPNSKSLPLLKFFTSHLFFIKKLELREIEKFATRIKLIINASKENTIYYNHRYLVLFLVAYLIEFESQTALELNKNRADKNKVLEKLACNTINPNYDKETQNAIEIINHLIEYHTTSVDTRKSLLKNIPDMNFYWEKFIDYLQIAILFK